MCDGNGSILPDDSRKERGGGAGAGAGIVGTGAGYELRARQQMEQLEKDRQEGRINQHDYETRKDQIQKGSIFY